MAHHSQNPHNISYKCESTKEHSYSELLLIKLAMHRKWCSMAYGSERNCLRSRAKSSDWHLQKSFASGIQTTAAAREQVAKKLATAR